ncbi:aminopeptidase N-like [Homarus americanus]|uniref:aminopeptidase N-like n=1 Tax=Homarus americanus TaxID=6706 RepID=UPI001C459F83|nr:aminopeptidase N-like [Homarus americanus]
MLHHQGRDGAAGGALRQCYSDHGAPRLLLRPIRQARDSPPCLHRQPCPPFVTARQQHADGFRWHQAWTSKVTQTKIYKFHNAFFLNVFTHHHNILTPVTFALGTTVTSVPPTTSKSVGPSSSGVVKKRPDVRLPRALKPTRYVVKLQPFINGDFSIRGYLEVEMVVLEPTSNITLHIDNRTKNDTVRIIPVADSTRPAPTITHHTYDQERQFYIASLSEPLEAGTSYVLTMAFLAHLNTQLNGFYKSQYKDEDGTDRWVAATLFQPTEARRAFPCFDEPELKATFEIFLAREHHMTSLSNMPLMETFPMERQEGWVWDHYPPSVPMSTYLVLAVSNYTYIQSNDLNHVMFRGGREEVIDHAHYSLRIGQEMLAFYEYYFGIPFPLPKLDSITVPENVGGMENWGLVLYGETSLLYEAGVSSAANKQSTGFIVSHELAHQWFGNLVTPRWWDDLWLNEGFASYTEYVALDHVEPSWSVMEQFVFIDIHDVFAIDCLESSHPINLPVQHPDDIKNFDRITYAKGASVIRMMNHFLTEATFRRGLADYLSALQYGSAVQDDLWEYLTKAAHQDQTLPPEMTVKMVMDTWTLQMGYPVIKVVRSEDGTSATISQERFRLTKRENQTTSHDYRWWVPLTFTSQDNPVFSVTQPMAWMKNTDAQIIVLPLPKKEDWVVFNLQQTGYYRVNYDDHNWGLIIHQLLTDHSVINALNRAQLLDDALDLARASQLSYDIALRVVGYLNRETEYVPWASALDNMDYLYNMFTHSPHYAAFKNYLLDLIMPLYESVGFADNWQDPHLQQYKRVLALSWACKLQHQDCVDNSVSLFHQWMLNPANHSIISPNLRSTVYCTAIAAGGQVEWDFVWAQYLNTSVRTEKQKLLSALGCTKQTSILSRFLDMVFGEAGGIKYSESRNAYYSVAKNGLGRPLVWPYFRNHWQEIRQRYASAFDLHRFVKIATSALTTAEDLQEVQAFREAEASDLQSADRVMNQAVEKIVGDIIWRNQNHDYIVQWLHHHGYSL